MEMLEAALEYLSRGYSVFPVAIERTPKGWSKTPLSARPMERAFTVDELMALWPATANGIGLELGKVSGVMRLDAEGDVPWSQFGKQPNGGEFTTPSGGRGWLLEYYGGYKSDKVWKGKPGEHAELKLMCDNLYTVIPPSVGYSWVNDDHIGKVPEWLMARQAEMLLAAQCATLSPVTAEPDKEEVLAALSVLPADGYEEWLRVGMALKQSGYDLSVWDEWSKKADAVYEPNACAAKWDTFRDLGRAVTARSILYSAEQHGFVRRSKHEPLTDAGFARVLARVGEGRILHSSTWGWLAYHQGRWVRNDAEKHVQEIQKSVLKIRKDAAIKSLIKHLGKDQSAPDWAAKRKTKMHTISTIQSHEDVKHILGARQLANSEPLLSCDYAVFDKHPMLLNVTNGTLDLRNRELRPHDPLDRLTQMAPTPYDADAQCPRFLCFVDEVFDGDTELVAFVRRLLGYCLTGSTEQHVLPIWHGSGRNGKSTLVRVMLNVLGNDYACTTSSGFLAASGAQQHPTKIADLYGKRFAADLETSDDMRLDEELMKRLTGGDRLKARRMREDFWEFDATHKLVLATNHEPAVRNQNPAVWGRILKVPFVVSFLGREEKDLDAKLAAESPGILSWLVEGCYEWQDMGLAPPAAVVAATKEYRAEQNTVHLFHDQMVKAEGKILKATLYTAYKAWCEMNSCAPVPNKMFYEELRLLRVEMDKNYAQCSLSR